MFVHSAEVPGIPNLLKEIDKILVSRGLTRKTTIEGDTLQAVGEAGLGLFYIIRENKTSIKVEARNHQAYEIISNLVTTELKELTEKNKKLEVDEEEKIEQEQLCSVCKIPLELMGGKLLWDEFKVKVLCCPKCNKIEFFKEEVYCPKCNKIEFFKEEV